MDEPHSGFNVTFLLLVKIFKHLYNVMMVVKEKWRLVQNRSDSERRPLVVDCLTQCPCGGHMEVEGDSNMF